MGAEPWLQFISSIEYAAESTPIVESDGSMPAGIWASQRSAYTFAAELTAMHALRRLRTAD